MKFSIPYDDNNKLHGIFYFFNDILKQRLFSISTTTHSLTKDYDPIQTTYRNNSENFYWCSTENNPNITFSFNQISILLTDYVISNAPKHTFPEEFVVYGSNDNETWYEIDKKEEVNFCGTTNGHCSTSIPNKFTTTYPKFYSNIKFMNLKNSYYEENKNYILFSSIEFFGQINYYQIYSIKCLITINMRALCYQLINIIL